MGSTLSNSLLLIGRKRYRLERAFGGASGEPVGCMLFTCNGRGEAPDVNQTVGGALP